MIQSVDQGLKRYREMRRNYIVRIRENAEKYGHSNWTLYGGDDYAYLATTDAQLSAAAEVLGLTKEEQEEIREEIEAELSQEK